MALIDKDTLEGIGCGIVAALVLLFILVAGIGLAGLTELK